MSIVVCGDITSVRWRIADLVSEIRHVGCEMPSRLWCDFVLRDTGEDDMALIRLLTE